MCLLSTQNICKIVMYFYNLEKIFTLITLFIDNTAFTLTPLEVGRMSSFSSGYYCIFWFLLECVVLVRFSVLFFLSVASSADGKKLVTSCIAMAGAVHEALLQRCASVH